MDIDGLKALNRSHIYPVSQTAEARNGPKTPSWKGHGRAAPFAGEACIGQFGRFPLPNSSLFVIYSAVFHNRFFRRKGNLIDKQEGLQPAIRPGQTPLEEARFRHALHDGGRLDHGGDGVPH